MQCVQSPVKLLISSRRCIRNEFRILLQNPQHRRRSVSHSLFSFLDNLLSCNPEQNGKGIEECTTVFLGAVFRGRQLCDATIVCCLVLSFLACSFWGSAVLPGAPTEARAYQAWPRRLASGASHLLTFRWRVWHSLLGSALGNSAPWCLYWFQYWFQLARRLDQNSRLL